jgi:hypothetical protein
MQTNLGRRFGRGLDKKFYKSHKQSCSTQSCQRRSRWQAVLGISLKWAVCHGQEKLESGDRDKGSFTLTIFLDEAHDE